MNEIISFENFKNKFLFNQNINKLRDEVKNLNLSCYLQTISLMQIPR